MGNKCINLVIVAVQIIYIVCKINVGMEAISLHMYVKLQFNMKFGL